MAQLLKGIGKQLQIGIAKEVTRGVTPATIKYWIPTDDWEINEKFENAIDDVTYGVIEDNVGQTRVKDWAEGQFKLPLVGTTSAVLLYSLFGSTSAVLHAGETVVWDNTISIAQNVQHQSLSFYVHDPIPTAALATPDYSYANAVVTKVDIDYSLGKFVELTASISAFRGSAAAVAFVPSQPVEVHFVPQYLTFKVASAVGGLTAASAIKIKSAKISIDASSEADEILGDTDPRDYLNKEFKIEGTVEAIWQNESDFRTAAIANTPQAMRLDLVNSDVTIGTATNPQIRLDLTRVIWTEFSRPIKIRDVVYQTLKFKAAYSVTDGYMARMLVVNTNVLSSV